MVIKVTKASQDYAKILHELCIPKDILQQTADIIAVVPQIKDDLSNPSITLEKKHNVIEKVFPIEIRDFLKVLCDDGDFAHFNEILEAFEKDEPRKNGEELVTLSYVTPPSEEQMSGIRTFLQKELNTDQIEIVAKEDSSLVGGFVLRAGTKEYDWSTKGRLQQLEEKLQEIKNKKANSEVEEGIISILKAEIEEFELEAKDKEIGVVTWVGDGIANIDGIDHAVYGEIVIFDTGVKGMVQDIRRNDIGCILFGKEDEIREGTKVVRTGKRAGVPVGEAFKGRVVNALGEAIDGGLPIESDGFRPIENEAPSIIDRKPVNVPMETGILAIDSMFPIGRGQRELIIGDRQTGKSALAVDTILNQKGKDVVCIYVAIGQKASTVAQLVNTLKKHNAMDYTVVVTSTASEPAPMQYIAPYAGTAIAEYFMYHGQDVLIVYDDLSKHAVAYRAISLLLERPPGREAYPGDVFYLHSRLLERSSRLSDVSGGGSITALPIIETQAGDVSAYIPTNVISITDGQIFLESDLFNSGMRPAVNVGLSVSRVGGAAQTKAMKKAAGSIRIDLAQFREMEVFTQFSSDLDENTKEQLAYGGSLMELLKQPLYHPLSMAEQVITLWAATHKLFAHVEKAKIKELQGKLLAYFHSEHADIVKQIETDKAVSEDLGERIIEEAKKFMAQND